MCPDDPFNDSVSDLVVDHPVVSTADEKLVLKGEQGGAQSQRDTIMAFGICKSTG